MKKNTYSAEAKELLDKMTLQEKNWTVKSKNFMVLVSMRETGKKSPLVRSLKMK